jgi:hypothetical protein
MTALPPGSLFIPNTPVTRTVDGVSYTVLFTPEVRDKQGKLKAPSSLRISITVPTEGEFHLLPEGSWDRFGKALGIAQEIVTEDAEFDRRCYIRSDTPAFASAYLSDPMKRLAILDLQRLGFPEVHLENGELAIMRTGLNPRRAKSVHLVEEAAVRLVILSRNLPPSDPELLRKVGTRRIVGQWILWLFLLLSALSLIVGIISNPLDERKWIVTSFLLAGVALPLFAVLSALLLRGTSTSHLAWLDLMIGAVFLLPLGSCGTVATVNRVADDAPPQIHQPLIVHKYTGGRRTTSYYVQCHSWRRPGEMETFAVSASVYAAIVENRSHLEVVTRPGALGIEWLVSWRVIP